MTKSLTKLVATAVVLLFAGTASFAQHNEWLSLRLFVEEPSAIARWVPEMRTTNNGFVADTNNWGAFVTTPYLNRPVVLVEDSLGCPGSITNAASIAGKWALIKRGTCMFAEKAYAAQLAGAEGVVIYNNVPGGVAIGMAKGTNAALVTIPAISISYEEGMSWRSELESGTEVLISLTQFGTEKDYDLAIVPGSGAAWHAGAIPLSQISGASESEPYKDYNGAWMVNTGNLTAENAALIHRVNFTPTGGSATELVYDSLDVGTFDTIGDYFRITNTANNFSVPVSEKGTLKFMYDLKADNEQVPSDNHAEWDVYVTDSVMCKSLWNPTTGTPRASRYYSFTTGSLFTGPMMYIANGGHTANQVQFSVAASTLQLTGKTAEIYLYKFNNANGDVYAEGTELELVGTGLKQLTAADSGGEFFLVNIENENDPLSPVVLQEDSWYFVGVYGGEDLSVGLDSTWYSPSVYHRALGSQFVLGQPEPYSGQFNGGASLSEEDTLKPYPFYTYAIAGDSISNLSFLDIKGRTPSVALHISKSPTAVSSVKTSNNGLALYPIPATNAITYTLKNNIAQGKGSIKVIDIAGRVLLRQDVVNDGTAKELSTANLANGTYWFVYNDNEHLYTQKFTVLRN